MTNSEVRELPNKDLSDLFSQVKAEIIRRRKREKAARKTIA
jgi:hypothetical protein